MSRKRRIFDIDLPEDTPERAPETKAMPSSRRGPMASAIAENAEALQTRKSTAAQIREENDALAHEFVALREAGQVVQSIPLDDVQTYMLVRDRIPGDDPELEDLVTSIRELGLSNPIRVMPRPDGKGFELVQGYRRLTAYKELRDAGEGQGDWSRIPALVMPGEPDIAGLYRRMVDENVIRKDLSFAEMAYAAQNYAADPATEANDVGEAVAALFQSAAYSKRNYIRNFAYLLDRLGKVLNYPTEIPRALGVSLAREIKERPDLAREIGAALMAHEDRNAAEELDILRRHVAAETEAPAPPTKPAKRQGTRSKTTFHIRSSAGQVKCTAGPGRLEIKVDRDFSSIERARLEQAIASLIDGLT